MSEKSVLREFTLRGQALQLSITIESNLLSIIYFSTDEHYELKGDMYYFRMPFPKLLRIKNLTFAAKIERLECVLKIYHPDLHSKYSALIEEIKKYREFRNRIAHCAFSWTEDLKEFDVYDVVESEGKIQLHIPFRYNYENSLKYISTCMGSIISPLSKLIAEIQLRLKKQNPTLYAQLLQEDR